MFMEAFDKDWQVEAQGKIYVADFEELKQWIAEGAVLPSDKVKRGNLRWLAAEKVPELCNSFYLYNMNAAFPDATAPKDFKSEYGNFETQFAFEDSAKETDSVWRVEKFCWLHEIVDTAFVCDFCRKSFCKDCPKSYGGKVKICPICDALCRSIDEPARKGKPVGAINKPDSRITGNTGESRRRDPSAPGRSYLAKAVFYSLNYLIGLIETVKLPILSKMRQ